MKRRFRLANAILGEQTVAWTPTKPKQAPSWASEVDPHIQKLMDQVKAKLLTRDNRRYTPEQKSYILSQIEKHLEEGEHDPYSLAETIQHLFNQAQRRPPANTPKQTDTHQGSATVHDPKLGKNKSRIRSSLCPSL